MLALADTGALGRATSKPSKGSEVDHGAELAEVQRRLADLADMFVAEEIGRAEWLRARTGLEARQTAAQAALAHRSGSDALLAFSASKDALRRGWKTMSDDRKRAVLHAAMDRVVVAPPDHRGSDFDETRVDIVWGGSKK